MRPLPLRLAAAVLVLELALLFALRPANAAPATPAAGKCISCRYSGAQLVKDYFDDKARYSLHEEAWAYIDGVYNATEGRDWCYPKVKERINRDELAGGAAWALKALPPEVLKGAAAPLIVAYFRKTFPCRGLP